jgi:hypothetical protein
MDNHNKETANTGAIDNRDLPTGLRVIAQLAIGLAADPPAIDPVEIINGVKVRPFQAKGRHIDAKGSKPARRKANGTTVNKAVIAVTVRVPRQG